MVVKAFERTTAAGAVVVFACIFVVATGKVVKHAWADRGHGFGEVGLAPAHVVDHAGQAEAGASTFLALVQYQTGFAVGGQKAVDVFGRRELGQQTHCRRQVGAVAQVAGVFAGAELAVGRSRWVCSGFFPTALANGRLGPHHFGQAEHVFETVQPVRATVDEFACFGEVTCLEGAAHVHGFVEQKFGEQQGRNFRRVGQVGVDG